MPHASNFDQPRGANSPADPGVGGSIVKLAVGVAGQQPAPTGPSAGATGTPTTLAPPAQTTPLATASRPATQVAATQVPMATATTVPVAQTPVAETPIVIVAPPPVAPSPSVVPGMPTTGAHSIEWQLLPLLFALGGMVALVGIRVRPGKRR
ncbi:MAG: hypothetical protein M3014_06430 [Chloroflexota bacterium]|nr:hypothetical protein [Chloroflexota bacterium]